MKPGTIDEDAITQCHDSDFEVSGDEEKSDADFSNDDADHENVDTLVGNLPDCTNPALLWRGLPVRQMPDHYGYGRNPAFWFTLNLPYNYLWEIHRFHKAVEEAKYVVCPHLKPEFTEESENINEKRVQFVVDNPDIVAQIHAIRVELNVRNVMSHIVPPDENFPFQYWLRFEWGLNGNPHVHGESYVANIYIFFF